MAVEDTHFTEPLILRQMVNTSKTHSSIRGGYFMFMGGINGGSYEVNKVKVFAKVEDYYKFLNVPLEDLNIKLDNSITTPYIQISYYGTKTRYTLQELTSNSRWIYQKKWYLICPEIYLPEKLLEINITNQ